jgi:hypothetical protein
MTEAKLWICHALTPYGKEYGRIVVVAATREEAIEKARQELSQNRSNYVPDQDYAQALLDNLDNMYEVPGGVTVDWDAARRVGR